MAFTVLKKPHSILKSQLHVRIKPNSENMDSKYVALINSFLWQLKHERKLKYFCMSYSDYSH